jgi:flagellar biosynthesis/type III secretory pathway protein FliH
MNKKKRKAIKEASKKAAIQEITKTVVDQLNSITAELGQDSKKLKKEIEKRAAQLAKKIVKKLKAVTPVTNDVPAEEPAPAKA